MGVGVSLKQASFQELLKEVRSRFGADYDACTMCFRGDEEFKGVMFAGDPVEFHLCVMGALKCAKDRVDMMDESDQYVWNRVFRTIRDDITDKIL